MKTKLSDFWRIDGTIGRAPYALIGLLLFAVKHNLDRFVAWKFFGRPWSVFSYLRPAITQGIEAGPSSLFVTLLILSLPFAFIGVLLTVKRLRAAHLPIWVAILFFVPFVNLLLFATLCVLPSRRASEIPHDSRPSAIRTFFDWIIPDHPLGAAAIALMLTIVAGLLIAKFSVDGLSTYGAGLFLGVPFAVGMVSVLIYGYHRPRGIAACLGVANLAVLLLAIAFLLVAFEGAICLLMAAPIGVGAANMGGLLGYAIQTRPWQQDDAPPVLFLLVFLLPCLMGADAQIGKTPDLYAVRTSLDVDAPASVVWRNVVSFSELPPPEEMLFRIGIAYPMRAEIKGQGPGAVRYCQFSTGPFVEPIEVWDAPRLLKFTVTANPAPMEEWTPYKEIHPRHLHGFLASRGGQFRLIALPGGRTRLEGTTWYAHHLEPGGYWKLWSDGIIHQIHLRVLRHVKALSEREVH